MRYFPYGRISLASVLAQVVCAWPARSQDSSCLVRKLPVSFRDSQNAPLHSIPIADLEARVHGNPAKILSIAPDFRPHRLVLLLDTSGSVGSPTGKNPLWGLELSLALHFFALNRERAQIAFASFSDHVNEVIDFSQGNSAVRDMLQQLANDRDYVKTHVKGRTALWDAVFRGVQLLDHPTFADAVYVLTDGGDNASHHKAGDLLRYLDVTSVRLFAVLLYQRSGYRNRTPEESYGSSDLAEIAGKTGGEILTAAERKGDRVALSADAAAKLKAEETLSRLYQAILQDNMLEIELPFPIAKNERFELKVSGTSRGKWKGIQITYPTTLLSCNAEVSGTGRR